MPSGERASRGGGGGGLAVMAAAVWRPRGGAGRALGVCSLGLVLPNGRFLSVVSFLKTYLKGVRGQINLKKTNKKMTRRITVQFL